jgi:hypothetical protein
VRITNPENRHRVFCEASEIDPNFLLRYNQSPRSSIDEPAHSIVMSEWYRDRLGNLSKQTEIELELVLADNAWAGLRACLQHPQIVVRLSTKLAIVSVMLGLIGLLFGVLSLFSAECLK